MDRVAPPRWQCRDPDEARERRPRRSDPKAAPSTCPARLPLSRSPCSVITLPAPYSVRPAIVMHDQRTGVSISLSVSLHGPRPGALGNIVERFLTHPEPAASGWGSQRCARSGMLQVTGMPAYSAKSGPVGQADLSFTASSLHGRKPSALRRGVGRVAADGTLTWTVCVEHRSVPTRSKFSLRQSSISDQSTNGNIRKVPAIHNAGTGTGNKRRAWQTEKVASQV